MDNQSPEPGWAPTGDADIDRVRREAAQSPTDAANLWHRVDALWAWMVLLQRLDADLTAFLPVLDRFEVRDVEACPPDALRAVDEAFAVLGRIQANAEVPAEVAVEPRGDRDTAAEDARPAPWPGYAGNPEHTAATDEPGPLNGRIAWRFATGLAWYVCPAVEGGRVYATSPGMRTMLWCLDLETGRVLWKTRRRRRGRATPYSHIMPQSYTTPGAASTPQVLAEAVVLAEMGAQGREEGRRRLLWIDKATGELKREVPVGWADYRTGYARLAGTDQFLVHTDGVQRVQPSPPQCIGHNRVLCRRSHDGTLAWDFPVGLTFGNPAVDDERAYVGTRDGVLFALNLGGASEGDHFGYSDMGRVAWQFRAGGAINGTVGLTADRVIFGANDGVVYCLDKATGDVTWTCRPGDAEPRAFQLFSTPSVGDGRVYIGSAGRMLACLDAASGALLWRRPVCGWVRSRPVARGGRVIVATLDGRLHCFAAGDGGPTPLWEVRLGEFGLFADLVFADGRVLATDARLRLFSIDAASGKVQWRHSLLEHAALGGREVQSDELACGGFHQSKPTAADGLVFVGSPCRFVFALDARTGVERWRFEMGAAISGAPAWAPSADGGGRLFVGQQGGEDDFYCLDARTGLPRWKQALGWVWSSATAWEGKVYVPCVDGHLACLDAATGHVLWRYRTGRAAHPEPPVEQGRVFFGSWDHFVYAFDAGTGRPLWKFHTGGSPDSGAPIASGGRLYLPMGGKRFACLDAASGAVWWETGTACGCMNASPALWNGRLYISTSVRIGAIPPASEVRCLDAADGRLLWAAPGGGITGPAVAAGRVYFASTSGCLFTCADAVGGPDGAARCLWRARMGDRVYESVPAIYGGRAFILNEDGYLYAFE